MHALCNLLELSHHLVAQAHTLVIDEGLVKVRRLMQIGVSWCATKVRQRGQPATACFIAARNRTATPSFPGRWRFTSGPTLDGARGWIMILK
jgi:hypothetical protein